MAEGSNVKVVCRVRPVRRFGNQAQAICKTDAKTISLSAVGGASTAFEFDAVLGVSSAQEEVYKVAAHDLVESVLCGYDGALLCYGQTGSGKTYTLEGSLIEPRYGGILPRAAEHICCTASLLDNAKITVSFVEIDLERIHDLLVVPRKRLSETQREGLSIREKDDEGPKVQGCNEVEVMSSSEILDLARLGSSNRHVAATQMNYLSSRSHSIFTITVTHLDPRDGRRFSGTLHLVDLVGSEKQGQSCAEGQRLDANHRSLSALEDVVAALAECSPACRTSSSHVPYRNSKLTLLLREALGRSANAVLVANVFPDEDDRRETLSTLRFGTRAMCVENLPLARISKPEGCAGRGQHEQMERLGHALGKLRLRLGDLDSNVSSVVDVRNVDPQDGKLQQGSEQLEKICDQLGVITSSMASLASIVEAVSEKLELADLKLVVPSCREMENSDGTSTQFESGLSASPLSSSTSVACPPESPDQALVNCNLSAVDPGFREAKHCHGVEQRGAAAKTRTKTLDSVQSTAVGQYIRARPQANSQAAPSCPGCQRSMEWSSALLGAYSIEGWTCDTCHCSSQSSNDSRWFCAQCQRDLCVKCHKGSVQSSDSHSTKNYLANPSLAAQNAQEARRKEQPRSSLSSGAVASGPRIIQAPAKVVNLDHMGSGREYRNTQTKSVKPLQRREASSNVGVAKRKPQPQWKQVPCTRQDVF